MDFIPPHTVRKLDAYDVAEGVHNGQQWLCRHPVTAIVLEYAVAGVYFAYWNPVFSGASMPELEATLLAYWAAPQGAGEAFKQVPLADLHGILADFVADTPMVVQA